MFTAPSSLHIIYWINLRKWCHVRDLWEIINWVSILLILNKIEHTRCEYVSNQSVWGTKVNICTSEIAFKYEWAVFIIASDCLINAVSRINHDERSPYAIELRHPHNGLNKCQLCILTLRKMASGGLIYAAMVDVHYWLQVCGYRRCFNVM